MTDQDSGIWRTPDEVLRNLKTKKRNLQKRFQKSLSQSHIVTNLLDGQLNGSHTFVRNNSEKRRNPFRTSPNKRPRSTTSIDEGDTSDNTLFQLLNFSNSKAEQPGKVCVPAVEDSLAVVSCSVSKKENVLQWQSTLPVDWSLKTRLRVTSDKPFPWSERLTTAEEASGVTGFVRCHSLEGEGDVEYALDTSPRAQLHHCCQLWMHPCVSWLKMFPRHGSQVTISSSQGVALDANAQKALQMEWTNSLRSVFNLLRARQCPYFYFCAPTFTVLFRAAGIDGISNIHALLTPTTVGLRESLRCEGVDFTTPLLQEKDGDLEAADREEMQRTLLDEDEVFDDEEPMSWLHSVGIASEEFASKMATNKVNTDPSFANDNLPKSLIYVEDCSVQALFNFLLNSKTCTSATGILAGVPPTLLSPVAFLGASLQSLKVQQHSGLHLADKVYTLEVIGPILPHTVQYLATLLQQVQDNNFTLSSTLLEPTSSFATDVGPKETSVDPPAAFSQQNLSDCGLWPNVLQQMCARRSTKYVQKIRLRNGLVQYTP